jgi:(p)ppGpp synthase/HD superfamily hydrolase
MTDEDHEASQRAVDSALQLALQFHTGQRDKAGQAYVLHLLRVMMAGQTPEAKQVGVLHDLLEDTPATRADMERAGLSERVMQAVERLTKPEAVEYAEYIVHIAGDALACEVKLADLQDNYALWRVAYRAEHTQEDRRRVQRYILAHQFLTRQIGEAEFLERMKQVEAS